MSPPPPPPPSSPPHDPIITMSAANNNAIPLPLVPTIRHETPERLPPPLDDPNCAHPLDGPQQQQQQQHRPLQWGILGCGRVSHDWCQALKHFPKNQQVVVACATQDNEDRASKFASLHHIPTSYGSYLSLLQDPAVHVVYVGTLHIWRRQVVEQCLQYNKHVVVEKPFAMNAEDAEYLFNLAQQKRNLFVMEGMWTRFFPAVQHARYLIQQGVIGDVCTVISDFNINASDHEEYPTSFFYQSQLGGGATMLVGPYPIAAAIMAFDGREPVQVKAVGQIDARTNVDLHATMVLNFAPTETPPPPSATTPKVPGAGTATLNYGILCESEEITTIIGTQGRLTVLAPAHTPTSIKVERKGHGRGNVSEPPVVYHYPLPIDTPDIVKAGGFHYPNSAGFVYEIAAVARCIASGKTQAPQYTWDETLFVLRIMDQVQQQLRTPIADKTTTTSTNQE